MANIICGNRYAPVEPSNRVESRSELALVSRLSVKICLKNSKYGRESLGKISFLIVAMQCFGLVKC